MVSEDERREVAAKLRHEARTCIHSVLISPDDALRLADLIDPGESGQNLDTNRDTVQQESPAVPKAPECDREALLSVADALDDLAVRESELTPLGYSTLANRIREACGEVGA